MSSSTRATVGRIMPCDHIVGESVELVRWRVKFGINSPIHQVTKSPTALPPDGEILEPGVLADERELDDAGRAVALLADDQLRHALCVGRRLTLVGVLILAIDEDDDVGVLFEGTGLAQVGELRPV